MIPILYESTETLFDNNGLGRLRDCITCTVTEERNGIYEVDFEYPVNGQHYSDIQLGRIVAVEHDDTNDIQPFDIVSVSRPIDGVVSFHGVHVSYRLRGMTVWGSGINSLADALTKLEDAVPASIFHYWTDKSSTGYCAAFDGKPKTVRAILGGVEGSILDAYGGEYEWDWFSVLLWQSRGEKRDFSIRYGVNMVDYVDETDYSETFTAVTPYYVNPDGSVLIQPIVSSGQPGLGGREVCVPYDVADKVDGSDVNTLVNINLTELGEQYLAQNRPYMPSQTITVDFVRLQDSPEYANLAPLLSCRLCDTIRVIMPMYDTEGDFKIVKTVWDVLGERYTEMELGTLSTTLSEALGIDTGGGGSTSTTTGAVYTDTESVAISSTSIDNNTTGASVTVPPGTYIVTAEWNFNTRSTTGTTNSAIRILDGNNSKLAETRIFAAGNNWNSLQCTAVVTASAQMTLTVNGASSRAYNSAQPTTITAVRII